MSARSRTGIAGLSIFVAALVTLAIAAQASALVYWANSGINDTGNTIGRANLDGSEAHNAFIASGDEPCGIAIDDEYIYWGRSAFPAGSIGRARLDGTEVEPQLIPAGSNPCGVAVDDSHVYWGDWDNGSGNTIGRANLDGSNVDPDFITTNQGVCGVAVDSGHIYWTLRAGDVGRANLNGTGVEHDFIAEANGHCGIEVSSTHVYFSHGTNFYHEGSIGRANLDGSGANTDFIPNAAGVETPCGIAVDGQYIYWGDMVEQSGPGQVGRANLNGTGVAPAFITTTHASCGVAVSAASVPAPACADLVVRAQADRPKPIALDCSGTGPLLYEVMGSPASGTITGLNPETGELTYTPNTGFTGSDSFTYLAANGGGPSDLATVTIDVDPPNRIRIGKPKRNARRGTAKLPVTVPGEGKLVLAGKGVKGVRKAPGKAGKTSLRVGARGQAAKKLRKRGKVVLRARVKFKPAGGEARTKTKLVKLVKR